MMQDVECWGVLTAGLGNARFTNRGTGKSGRETRDKEEKKEKKTKD